MPLALTRLDKTAARVVGRLLGNSSKSFGKDFVFRIPDSNAQYSTMGQRMYSLIGSNVVAASSDNSFTWAGGDFSALVPDSYVHVSSLLGDSKNEGWMKVTLRTATKLTVSRNLSDATEAKQFFLSSSDVPCKGYIVDSSQYDSLGLSGPDYRKFTAIALMNLNQLPSGVDPVKWLCFDNLDATVATEYKVAKVQPIYSGQVAPLGYVMLNA